MPDAWRTCGTRSILGETLLVRRKYAEAEPLLVSNYSGLRHRKAQIPAANKPRLKTAAERLVRLYEETAQLDKAAQWKQTLAKLPQP